MMHSYRINQRAKLHEQVIHLLSQVLTTERDVPIEDFLKDLGAGASRELAGSGSSEKSARRIS